VLAVKLADLGDLLLCEPALRALRAAWPICRIDVLTPPSSSELVPLLDERLASIEFPKGLFDSWERALSPRAMRSAARLALRLRAARYDLILFFHHLTTTAGARKFGLLAAAAGARETGGLDNGRGSFLDQRIIDRGFGAMHEVDYMLAVATNAGGVPVDPRPRLPERSVDRRAVPTSPYAVLFPATGSYAPARAWMTDRYATVAAWLDTRGLLPVVVGGADARAAARTIRSAVPSTLDLAGRTSLSETAGVVADARVVIGGDSFVGHLAAALDRPLVSIFGPSNSDAWRPYTAVPAHRYPNSGGSSLVVRHPLPCSPCIYTGHGLGRPAGCPARTCLDLVSTADVIAATQRALESV
jgi:heptosyltransferase-2